MAAQQSQHVHPSHPVRGSVQQIMRNMAFEKGKFEDFNAGYVKYSHKRPSVDHGAIKNPLNQFMSYGIAEYCPPSLLTKSVVDEARDLMDYSIKVLGTPQ